MNKKILCVASLLTILSLTSCGGGSGDGSTGGGQTGPTKEIVIDGGGDIGNYNSTPSMTETASNQYPYNTLETLCKEWEKTHPGYKVKINRTSSAGNREVLLPQLKQGTSPHIIYQNGNVVNTDLGQDYYVDLTDYLNAPSPYLKDNANWATVYNEDELAATQAADGHYYYVNMEKIPVCFMYNKTLLNKAGVTNPESINTYGQLISAMEKVDNYAKTLGESGVNVKAYSTTYTWYQIAMESNLFSDLMDEGDVLRKNGVVDTEELCRLYTKGLYNPGLNAASDADTFENNKFYEYIRLIENLDKHKAVASYDCEANWVLGNLAFMEVTGKQLRKFYKNSNIKFEWGTVAFPEITKEDSSYAAKPVVRGTAGLATSWWVSKRAKKDGTVEACIDLLQYLTAPEQNNRMVGDLKGGIPLNPSDDFELASYLTPLLATYNSDIVEMKEGKRVVFNAFNSWAVMGTSYSNLFIRTMQEVDAGTRSSKQATVLLSQSLKNTVASYRVEYEYDESKW